MIRSAQALACAALTYACPGAFAQEPTFTNFTGFTPGASVDGQGGWSSTNVNWDEEVVEVVPGDLRWRVSNAVTSGSFGDQPFAPATDLYAGESGSTHTVDSASAVTDSFYASFTIQSVTGGPQPGLDVTVSPDNGIGRRMSFLSIEDNGSGIDIDFFDTEGNNAISNPNGGFVQTVVASGLSYTEAHTIAFDITFVDGNVIDGSSNVSGNDIVKIFVDGELVHTGTTWESYYWTTTEGQTPPTVQAIDTLLYRLSTPGPATLAGNGFYIDNVFVSTESPEDKQGFELDTSNWEVFSSPVFFATRTASGTDGITSASGAWHATARQTLGQVPATNWGGYSGKLDCASSSCASGPFPTHGYTTSIDIFLDMEGGWADATHFDFSSAINTPQGPHRRDFIFNCGFFDTTNPTAPGAGINRFVIGASNNSGGQNPFMNDPFAVTTTGWYTFEHRFYATFGNVLAVDYLLKDSSGTVLNTWTRSNPLDIANVTVGGNRYGWFALNEFEPLAFDNACRSTGGNGTLVLDVADCQDDLMMGVSGYQVAVTVSMADLNSFTTGFQAFVNYDDTKLAYEGSLSSYTSSPFSLHLSPIDQVGVMNLPGELKIDGSVGFSDLPTDEDALLATLVFTVLTTECEPTAAVTFFQPGGTLGTELSYLGVPLETVLSDPAPFTLDDTPPVIAASANVTVPADAAIGSGCDGAVVTFTTPVATDNCTASPLVDCVPASGSVFPVGISMVTCTATDDCGNVSTSTFDVEVTATNLVNVSVELGGVDGSASITRCIHFVVNGCATTDIPLTFSGIPATFVGFVELPCSPLTGLVESVCAKDEQQTLWATSTVSLVGSDLVADTGLILREGDTDNDGDVDINDVTLLLAQFGTNPASGGCPFDGFTRNANFSQDNTVDAVDYTFLTSNWLETSSCSCSLLNLGGGPNQIAGHIRTRTAASSPIERRADLNKDGFVDSLDVRILEKMNNLPAHLSVLMAASR